MTYKTTVAIFITSGLQSEVHTSQFNSHTCYSTISAELLSQRPSLIRKELFEFNVFEILTCLSVPSVSFPNVSLH